ncbi:hypothetical protein ACOSQ2_020323 [Xanthoceras sorbifolium]
MVIDLNILNAELLLAISELLTATWNRAKNTSIAVNGQMLPIDSAAFAASNNRETIVDSGTTLTYLVEEAFDPFVGAC